jgi:hypothetical protein
MIAIQIPIPFLPIFKEPPLARNFYVVVDIERDGDNSEDPNPGHQRERICDAKQRLEIVPL